MPRIFISYKREERRVAEALAARLVAADYEVWWDADLVGGQIFDEAIKAEIIKADLAVILWSRKSAVSKWVKDEAAFADTKVVPVIIDDVTVTELPMSQQRLHIVKLLDWVGDPRAPGLLDLLRTLSERAPLGVAAPPVDLTIPPRASTPSVAPWWRPIAVVLFLIPVAGIVGYMVPRLQSLAPPEPSSEMSREVSETSSGEAPLSEVTSEEQHASEATQPSINFSMAASCRDGGGSLVDLTSWTICLPGNWRTQAGDQNLVWRDDNKVQRVSFHEGLTRAEALNAAVGTKPRTQIGSDVVTTIGNTVWTRSEYEVREGDMFSKPVTVYETAESFLALAIVFDSVLLVDTEMAQRILLSVSDK